MNPHPNTNGLRPPWKKGDPSPNPSGRPRRLPISDAITERALGPAPTSIRQDLEREGITLEADATLAGAIAARLLLQASSGDVAAAREAREASEGKAGLRIENRDAVDRRVELVVRYVTGEKKNKELMARLHGAETAQKNSEVGEGAEKTPGSS